MRFGYFLCVLVLLTELSVAASAQTVTQRTSSKVTVAVRPDVPPFVWKDEETGHYQGLFWDICIAALPRAGYAEHQVIEISADDRKTILETGAFKDGNGVSQTIDLLCDPTTITLARMAELDTVSSQRFAFSPILYVANGSYVQQAYGPSEFRKRLKSKMNGSCDDATGDFRLMFCEAAQSDKRWRWLWPPERPDADTLKAPDWAAVCDRINAALNASPKRLKTSQSTAAKADMPEKRQPQIWPEPTLPEPRLEVWGYVSGATLGQSVEQAAARAPREIGVCARELPSHEVAAQEFCAGRLFRYFGDVDIVRAAIATHRRKNLDPCPTNEQPSTKGTYEPYAMVVASSEAKPDLPEHFSAAIYSMFADGTVEQLFNGRFRGNRPSEALRTLFMINSIPTGNSRED